MPKTRSKTLLIVSGGIEAVPAIAKAKAMGLTVVVSDRNEAAPGFALADRRLLASTYHPDETLAAVAEDAARNGPPDGVIAAAADVPHTVAAVAETYGLPGPTPETARLATDKLAMKRAFAAAGVAVPWFAEAANTEDVAHVRSERRETLVIKPVDSRGVVRLLPDVDSAWAYDQAAAHSPSGRVMVEAYLPGPQVSTESLVLKGTAHTPGFSDRNYALLERFAPYFIENGGDLPGALDAPMREAVCTLITQAARALGADAISVKGDVVIHDGRPHIIELAAGRLSGGYFSTLEIPLNTGVDFVGAVIRTALGERVDPEDLRPKRQTPVCQRYVWAQPGEVVRIDGLAAARALPGIEEVIPGVAPGSIIPPTENTTGRAVMILATGRTPGEARIRAEAAVEAVTVHTTPVRDLRAAGKGAARAAG